MTRGLAFLRRARPPDYGSRLSGLRWARGAQAETVAEWGEEDLAPPALAAASSWVVVRDVSALPLPLRIPEPPYGRVLLAQAALPEPVVHTLRELEGSGSREADRDAGAPAAALAFWPADFPAGPDESIGALWTRLVALAPEFLAADPSFRAIVFDEPSRRERPELTARLPPGALRILDVGCGAGGGVAEACVRNPGWRVTGVEQDCRLAAQARTRCERVEEGDLRDVLPRLAAEGAQFEALIFADVLEHLDEPAEALRGALPLAAPGARLLVSVPNVGHLSVARDLLSGRFDPVPAGLCDAGHLRWFTRDFLAQTIEESGWSLVSVQSERGAEPPDAEAFHRLARTWPDGDLESLATYQWIAEARIA